MDAVRPCGVSRVLDRPEVWMVEVPDARYRSGGTNCYIVRSGDETLVVDVGVRSEQAARLLDAALRAVGARRESTRFFLTHLHRDHSGALPLSAPEGATVYAGTAELAASRALAAGPALEALCARLAAFGLDGSEVAACRAFRLGMDAVDEARFDVRGVADGDGIAVGAETLRVVGTAGHSAGHCSLYHEGSGVLFGGDHVLFVTSPYVSLYPGPSDRLALYLDRLRAVRRLDVRCLLQSHGRLRPADDGRAFAGRVDWLLAHRARRAAECREIVARMPDATGFEVVAALPSSRAAGAWESLPFIQRWCIAANGLAVLDHLECTGQVESRLGADGLRRYRAL